MFISEVSEVFMQAQDKGWGYSNGARNEESCGEALSLFLAVQFQISQGLGTNWLMNGTPSRWLNTSLPASNPSSTEFDSTGQFGGPSTGTHYGSRQDYIGSVKPFAQGAAKLGDHGDDLPLSCGTGVPPGFLVDLRAWRVPVSRM